MSRSVGAQPELLPLPEFEDIWLLLLFAPNELNAPPSTRLGPRPALGPPHGQVLLFTLSPWYFYLQHHRVAGSETGSKKKKYKKKIAVKEKGGLKPERWMRE